MGLDKKPRELHVPESLASIDFEDFEPGLVRAEFERDYEKVQRRSLADDSLFGIQEFQVKAGAQFEIDFEQPLIIALVEGKLLVKGGGVKVSLSPGEFCLIPADVKSVDIQVEVEGIFLAATAG